MLRGFVLLIAAAVWLVPGDVLAQQSPREPGDFLHDGLYVRLATGLSTLRDDVEISAGGGARRASGHVSGFGQGIEVTIGGAIVPGLVLAGGWFIDLAHTTSTDFDTEIQTDGSSYAMMTIGPVVDFYPDPEGGLHFQLGGGLGATSGVATADLDEPGGASGWGLVVGGGYEWWIAEQWALGALLRLNHVEAEDNIVVLFGDFEARHSANAISLLLTATYN